MSSPNARRSRPGDTELVASNNTANKFLGSRPKAWMQGGTANVVLPVRRRSSQAQSSPKTPTTPSRPFHSVLEERAPKEVGENVQSPTTTSHHSSPVVSNDVLPASEARTTIDLDPLPVPTRAQTPAQTSASVAVPVADTATLPLVAPATAPGVAPVPAHLPSPNLSHKSDPTVTSSRVEPVITGLEERQTVTPRLTAIAVSQQAASRSLRSPQASPSTECSPKITPVERQCDRDRHRDKRPRLAADQQLSPTLTELEKERQQQHHRQQQQSQQHQFRQQPQQQQEQPPPLLSPHQPRALQLPPLQLKPQQLQQEQPTPSLSSPQQLRALQLPQLQPEPQPQLQFSPRQQPQPLPQSSPRQEQLQIPLQQPVQPFQRPLQQPLQPHQQPLQQPLQQPRQQPPQQPLQPHQQQQQQSGALVYTGPTHPSGPPLRLVKANTDLSAASLQSCVPFLEEIACYFPKHEAVLVNLLRDACIAHDIHFLALFQLHCLSLTSSKSCPDLGADVQHGIAFTIDILRQRIPLSQTFLQYFSAFPSAFRPLVTVNPTYSKAVHSVISWARGIRNKWIGFFSRVRARGFPPLIDEMIRDLGVQWKIVQLVFYTACSNTLAANRVDLYNAWKLVFDRDCGYYHLRLLRYNTPNAVPLNQIKSQDMMLLAQYQQLARGYSASNSTTPTTPATQPINSPLASSPLATSQAPQFLPTTSQPATPHPVPNQPMTTVPLAVGIQPLQPLSSPQASSPLTTSQAPQAPLTVSQPATAHPVPNQPMTTTPLVAGIRPLPQPFRRRTMLQQDAQAITSPTSLQAPQAGGRLPLTVSTAMFSQGPPHMAPQQIYASSPVRQAPQSGPRPQTRLLPPRGAPAVIPADPSPLSYLHQRYLNAATVSLTKRDAKDPETFFQYLDSFALPPTPVNWRMQTHTWTLFMSREEHLKLPIEVKSSATPIVGQGLREGTRLYQMKCVQLTDKVPLTEEGWVMTECYWPKAFYLQVNGQYHHPRRKFHYGKDLPINISHALKPGENEIKVTILVDLEECNQGFFGIAVEIIDSASIERVRKSVQPFSQSESLDRIVGRLTNDSMDDDELSFVDDFITVQLDDPFMARVFDTPVRTVSCKHSECFDLDTFLSTRCSRRAKGPHGMAEDWKCPICNEDARPKRLIIDQFLVHVREELVKQSQLEDTSSIKVRADRTWDANSRQAGGIKRAQASSVKAEESATPIVDDTQSSPKAAQAPPEVIELD